MHVILDAYFYLCWIEAIFLVCAFQLNVYLVTLLEN